MELKIKKHEQVQLNRRGQGKWPQDKSNYQSSRNREVGANLPLNHYYTQITETRWLQPS